jgi:hypothetical protein
LNQRPTARHLEGKIVLGLGDDQIHTACPLAEILNVEPSTIHRILGEGIEMKPFMRRWIPHELTNPLRHKRLVAFWEISQQLRHEPAGGRDRPMEY